LQRQRQLLNAMVDWLAEELNHRLAGAVSAKMIAAQQKLRQRIEQVEDKMKGLLNDLRKDRLTRPEFVTAFQNVLQHVAGARRQRTRTITAVARANPPAWAIPQLRAAQQTATTQLEKDIIYLDDLLALQRIDELKRTGKRLLAAQRGLRELLQKYQETNDPALRKALEQQIRDLRQRMVELLAKMAQIKQTLPGEYRNMEAASMLKVGDELNRLEKMLREGDLKGAAEQVEQLANMIENMMNSIEQAEKEYGGERYSKLRQQLAEFAAQFRRLESQQKALASRTADMLGRYRKQSIRRAGKDIEAFVKKARKKTAEALQALDRLAQAQQVTSPLLGSHFLSEQDKARQRLLDLDALLETHDFSEARDIGRMAEQHNQSLGALLNQSQRWMRSGQNAQFRQARTAAGKSLERTREVNAMLDKLFPDPSEVLTPQQLAEMRRMGKKQEDLRGEAQRLGQRMDELSSQVPLFSGQPHQSLQSAEGEMNQAAGDISGGELPGGAKHGRRAADQLAKLRKALEKASKGGSGGLPLPLGMGQGGGGQAGTYGQASNQDVEIPQTDRNRAHPHFRQELLEAAKQKAPTRYEEAVRKYYEELIR